MATISNLPRELLSLVLDCVHKDQEGDADETGHREPVLRSLAAASLVARHWRIPAQSLMWSYLLLSESNYLNAVLANLNILHLDTPLESQARLPTAFHLTALQLGPAFDSPRLAEAILAASASTLTSLTISAINNAIHASLTSFLSMFAGSIQRLTFDPSETNLVLPHAPSFTSLVFVSLLLLTQEEIE
ncbi:hypothetical protein RQP46_010709 [Phenoliferia psychrophenolica]